MLLAPSLPASTARAGARLLLNRYSRLGLQAVHQGHEVVGDQTLLAGGERLRLPPLPAPARTWWGETLPAAGTPHRDPRQHRDTGRGAAGSCQDTVSAHSLFQDTELLTLPQPQVPVVLGLVVVQGHHQLIWEDKRRGRGAVAKRGAVHSRPLPRLHLTLQGGAWRRRGLVGHKGVLNFGAVADQPLPGDKEPRQPSVSWGSAIPWPPPEAFGHRDGGVRSPLPHLALAVGLDGVIAVLTNVDVLDPVLVVVRAAAAAHGGCMGGERW